jgi:hypothetical protein
MKAENQVLIAALLSKTEKSISEALYLKTLSSEQLNFKNHAQEWNALQCLEHLNLYGDFYLPKIEAQILKQKPGKGKLSFKGGMLGNYFANMIQVKGNKVRKYKAMKHMTAESGLLVTLTIERFLKQQELLKVLLKQCLNIDLNKPKVETALSRFIKLNMGDTLRFMVYHTERHMLQALNMVN